MKLPIITADQRLAEQRGVKGVLVGKSGIGKTSQLWTLTAIATLFFDLEAGDLAVEGWAGPQIWTNTTQYLWTRSPLPVVCACSGARGSLRRTPRRLASPTAVVRTA